MESKNLVKLLAASILFIVVIVVASVKYGSTPRSQEAVGTLPAANRSLELPVAATSTPEKREVNLDKGEENVAPTVLPTLGVARDLPVADTTPGGVSVFSKSDIQVVPNPVKSLPAQWKIYAEPFYSYTVAYPPEWFLTEPTGVRKTHGIHAKIIPGLSTSLNSTDLSKAPGTELQARNPQDALRIDISLEEDSLRSGESLKDYLLRQSWYWAESVQSLEEIDHDGFPVLTIRFDNRELMPGSSTGLIVLIAARDGRVYKIIAEPDPKDTIYSEAYQQIFDSITVLEN